jgi:uncharacterized protein (DUF697 family)
MSWLDTLEEIRKNDWSKASETERAAKANDAVNICGYAAAATSVVPIPLADILLLLPVHSVMVMTVGHIYGRKVTGAEAKRVVLELGSIAGLTFAGGAAINALRKLFLPAIGGLLAVPATFALTWGLGRVSMAYFSDPALSREDLKKVFEDALKEGKSSFSKEAFDRFRQRNEGVKAKDPEEAEPSKKTGPPKPAPEAKKAEPSPPPKPNSPELPKSELPKSKKRTL